MRIGIIGNGKMGKQIAGEFLLHNIKVSIYCIENIEKTEKIFKKIVKRMFKAGSISEEEKQKLEKENFCKNSLNELENCDVVIEAIVEDYQEKKKIFEEMDKLFSKQTIFVTNTSSLCLEKIFENVTHKERCAGLHFFYPVRVSSVVELNVMDETGKDVESNLLEIIELIEKRKMLLKPGVHFLSNKMISLVTTQAYDLAIDNDVDILKMNDEVLMKIMNMGAFDIVNFVGIPIIKESLLNLTDEYHKFLFSRFYKVCIKIENEGFKGDLYGSNIYDFFEKTANQKKIDDSESERFKEIILSVLLNDLFLILNDFDNSEEILFGIKEVLSLKATLSELYQTLGYQKLKENLDKLYANKPNRIYSVYSKKEYDDYYLRGGMN